MKALAVLLFSVMALVQGPAVAQEPARDRVVVETSTGARHGFNVELALTPEQQMRGLMFRESLPASAGMLFLYAEPVLASFWMRNTLIPLDLIFIRQDGRIANIHANAKPLDESPLRSAEPVTGILEINGGLAARLGIKAGDKVLHPSFKNTGK